MIKHLNVGDANSKEEKDQTYYDITRFHDIDKIKWNETKNIRIKDAKKLK